MSLLDFIKNRQAQPEPTASQPKPETAKEMYTRQDTQERAAAKPVQNLSPEQQGRVAEAKDLFRQGTQQVTDSPSAPAPVEGTAPAQPMRQMSMNQEKAAPELSPTSAQSGTVARESDAVAPAKSQESPKPTIARPTPSWER